MSAENPSIYEQHGYAVASIKRLLRKLQGRGWATAGEAEVMGQVRLDLEADLRFLEPMGRCDECATRADESKAKREAFACDFSREAAPSRAIQATGAAELPTNPETPQA